MLQTENAVLPGDWRASAYGAAKRAHLYVYYMPMDGQKSPACGARVAISKTGPAKKRKLNDLCYDCLVYGASGR